MENFGGTFAGVAFILILATIGLFWILFPILVWQELRRGNKLLERLTQIEIDHAHQARKLAEFFDGRNVQVGRE